jgi:hypothetical protein
MTDHPSAVYNALLAVCMRDVACCSQTSCCCDCREPACLADRELVGRKKKEFRADRLVHDQFFTTSLALVVGFATRIFTA